MVRQEQDLSGIILPDQKKWVILPKFNIHIHQTSVIGQRCQMKRNITIDEGANIDDDVEIGNNVTLHKGVRLAQGVKVLDNTVIYPDTVVGQETIILENCHLGRPPEIAGQITRHLKSDYPNLIVGERCLIGPLVRIYRGTKIGNQTSIYEFVTIREECSIGDEVVLAPGVTVNYATSIGRGSRVMHSTHLTGNMVVGEDVFISLHVGSTNDKMKETSETDRSWQGAVIEDKSVIGAGVMLYPGVRIGRGSHIAIQSVVNKDIPENSYAAGVPVRVLGKLP